MRCTILVVVLGRFRGNRIFEVFGGWECSDGNISGCFTSIIAFSRMELTIIAGYLHSVTNESARGRLEATWTLLNWLAYLSAAWRGWQGAYTWLDRGYVMLKARVWREKGVPTPVSIFVNRWYTFGIWKFVWKLMWEMGKSLTRPVFGLAFE